MLLAVSRGMRAIALGFLLVGCASSERIRAGGDEHMAKAQRLEAEGDYHRAAKERSAAEKQYQKAQYRSYYYY
jgi:hypothetical protein